MEKVPCEPQVGADVEAFVYCVPTKTYVPCVGLLPGTKENPSPLPELPDGFAVQEDNVMAEFNIPPIKQDGGAFSSRIGAAKEAVEKLLPADHLLSFKSYHKFRPIDLTSDQAKTIGCDPDFDAYTGGQIRTNPPPLDLVRGAGGHIHLGGDFQCPDFVAALFAEAFIGICCGVGPKKNDLRGQWYGRPGVYRPKPYGIEYRTPSSEWAASWDTAEYVGNMALMCAKWLTNNEATTIQQAFRAIDWVEVSEVMRLPSDSEEYQEARMKLIDQFLAAEIPV